MFDTKKYREYLKTMPKEQIIEDCVVLATFSEMYRDIITSRCVMPEKELINKEFRVCEKLTKEQAPWLVNVENKEKGELN